MLHTRQLIPPLTLLTGAGRTVQAWDFKHKKNLVIAFLDAGCPLCEEFVQALANHAAELQEKETVVVLVSPTQPFFTCEHRFPVGIIAGWDVGGGGLRGFMEGEDDSGKQSHRGVFVTDRYGEISEQWIVTEHQFPPIGQILHALNRVEIACEECSPPEWPAED